MSLQSSRRHQKNDPVYRQRRNEERLNWRKKSGPAQDRRKKQVEILPLATNEICELSVDERRGLTLEFKSLIF
jgi:hypothetical protein